MQLSVVIPVFNEAKTIVDTVAKISDWLTARFKNFEIIVVDDASSDSTLEIIRNIPDIKVLRNLTNHGKGYTVAKGMRVTRGEMALFMDADNSTSIEELEKLLPHLDQYPIVIASRAMSQSRIHKSQNFLKVTLGRLGNLLIRSILSLPIRDTQCGFKLFRHSALSLFDKLTIDRWAFDFELLFIAKLHNFKIKEVPVSWTNNANSRVTTAAYFQTLCQVFKVRINHLLNKYK
ncbi:glycosyltransferase family 2 protein [bacterium]|jgi:dolichyl-phosphate beta-glucosyltransferase|nr:glycosyltransferase family 2 protein [Candidatus Komeilibacteria bacterium]MBT7553147.1 glycosyltransferase family 2 protein [bacterium]